MAFKKGQSGNPAGKPKGAKDKRTELRALFEADKADLVKTAITLAKSGDVSALRLCLDRLVAPVRSNPVRVEGFAGTLTERAEAVVVAVAKGNLSPDEASALMNMLQGQAKLIESDELDRRIAAIEKQLIGGSNDNNN